MTEHMINLFQPVQTVAPTNILDDSKKLNPSDMVKTMNEMFVIMVPKPSRAIRGEVNIKKYLYKDVVNPYKFKNEEDFNEDDFKMLEKFKAVKKVSAVIKSFLPDQYRSELFDYQYQVRKAFKEHCVSNNLNYMTRDASEHFKSYVKEIVQRQDLTLEKICLAWEDIRNEFGKQLRLSIDGITDAELANAMTALPTAEVFKNSYNNTFVYQTMGFDNCTTEVDFRSDKVKTAQEVAEDDFKEIIGNALAETMSQLDTLLVAMGKGVIASRTRGMVPEISKRLEEKTKFTGNYHIEAIVAKCDGLSHYLNNSDELPEVIEDIATDIYFLLATYNMTKYLEEIAYQEVNLDDLKILAKTKSN